MQLCFYLITKIVNRAKSFDMLPMLRVPTVPFSIFFSISEYGSCAFSRKDFNIM